MAERYTRVFTQQGQFYCPGAPVVIEAGALLKDNQTGKIIAQNKFKNISPKVVCALTVRISARDISGADVEGVDNFQYLDLNVRRDEEFGAKTPVVLPNAVTRAFSCECLSVIFSDGTTWVCNEDAQWDILPAPALLKKEFGAELAEQYQRDTKSKAEYKVTDQKDLWYCGCGAINHTNEDVCHRCHVSKMVLITALNLDTLRANKEKYDDLVSAEYKEKVEQEQKRKTVIKKRIVVVAVILALFACVVGGISIYNNLPSTKYKRAVSLMQEKQYVSAQEAFSEIMDYRDSALLLRECEWREGLSLYLAGKYDEANEIFAALNRDGDIQPSYITDAINNYWLEVAQKYIANRLYYEAIEATSNAIGTEVMDAVKESIYQRGLSFCEQEEYFHPIRIFELLGDYKDSPDLLQFARNEYEYQNALSLFNEGRYDEASDKFLAIIDYRDCRRYLETHYKHMLTEEKITTYKFSKKQNAGIFNGSTQYTYEYDTEGLVVRKANNHTEYKYENGILIEMFYSFTGQDTTSSYKAAFEYEYDDAERLIRKSQIYTETTNVIAANLYWEYAYDDDGKLLTETRVRENSNIDNYCWHYAYDEEGRIITVVIDSLGINGEVAWEAIYTIDYVYDEHGRLIEERNRNGYSNIFSNDLDTKVYTYDEWGNVTKIIYYHKDQETGTEYKAREFTYSYDWIYSPAK